MRIQACLHVDVDARRAGEGWLRDPWFHSVLVERLGDLVLPIEPVEQTPESSLAAGARWFDVGRRGRLGIIRVSDGVDVVLQVEEGYAAALRDRIFQKNRKRLKAFLRDIQKRWTAKQ